MQNDLLKLESILRRNDILWRDRIGRLDLATRLLAADLSPRAVTSWLNDVPEPAEWTGSAWFISQLDGACRLQFLELAASGVNLPKSQQDYLERVPSFGDLLAAWERLNTSVYSSADDHQTLAGADTRVLVTLIQRGGIVIEPPDSSDREKFYKHLDEWRKPKPASPVDSTQPSC